MTDPSPRVAIPGSRPPLPSHPRYGDAPAVGPAEVTVYLRTPQIPAPSSSSHEELLSFTRSSEEDFTAVRRFAESFGLTVGERGPGGHSLTIRGDIANLAEAFGARLGMYTPEGGEPYRALESDLELPAELDGVITGVFGFDQRPVASPHFRPRANATVQYPPNDVARAYDFPAGTDGTGQCVALIELGGGFRQDDIDAYFASLSLPVPSVEAVAVLGAQNAPSDPSGPDGEVMLDIEVVGAVAPGAKIAVYFAPNTDRGFIAAVEAAVHDVARKPCVVSISWGSAESTWSASAMAQMEKLFAGAAAAGVTVTVAAGDNGSGDSVGDGLAHVDFPASAPHALACGGTRLELAGTAISAETVWNDGQGGGATGGGVSTVFPLPSYQQGAGVPPSANAGGQVGRGVPDVCGDADPDTGYIVRVDSQTITVGGTSAVAPLWAGLVARLNQALGRPVGFLQPVLYSSAASGALHDITTGNNGAYQAGPGWDACTGLGSPDGAKLLAVFQAQSTALGGTAPGGTAQS
ncbi:MAG TPA: S53 family peptidase [Acidimicrobiales bacterium]|nr:S53 family peptidase [Acidimicrobiales bacterium]